MKILITTAHSPSQRTRSFVKDLVSVLPGSKSFTRGRASLDILGAIAADEGAEKVIIVKERHGNPSALEVYKVVDAELVKEGTIELKGVTLSREKSGRVFGVKRVGVRGYNLLPGVDEVARTIAELLGLELVTSPEEASEYSLLLDVEPKERGYEVIFRVPGSKAPVGPSWRVVRVTKELAEEEQ